MIDAFENIDYFIIVLEYISGGDLFDYLGSRGHSVVESLAKKIFI